MSPVAPSPHARFGAACVLLFLPLIAGWDWPAWMTDKRLAASQHAPVPLHQTPTGRERPHPVRTMRVRFWADPESRAGSFNWQLRMRQLLDDANAFTVPGFDVRFEAADFHKWQHPPVARLDELLDQLAHADPGDDVDLVVGIASPLQIDTESVHQAGLARLSGKHLILRPLSDAAEEKVFEDAYILTDADRQQLLTARRAHKRLVFFLHEWAHTLGGLHENDRQWLLSPSYWNKQGAFSWATTRVLEIALRHRLPDADGRYDVAAEAKELLAFVETTQHAEWSQADRAELVGLLRARAALDGARPNAAAPPPQGTAPPDVEAALEEGRTALSAGELGRAAGAWVRVREHVAAAAEWSPATWARVAELALNVGALTDGEAAVARMGSSAAPDAPELFARARRRIGLPARSAVPAVDEPAYFRAFWDISERLGRGDVRGAEALLRTNARFAELPGFLALSCELLARRNQPQKARGACDRALDAFEQTERAHFVLGWLETRDPLRRPSGIGHLERAIELDHDDKAPWSVLGEVYLTAGRRADYTALEARYEQAFGQPLREPTRPTGARRPR
jgi:tetratricopeptide (TPR) repeat protein